MNLPGTEERELTFAGCYARYEKTRLTIGNDEIERIWEVRGGLLYPLSLRHKRQDAEWLAGASAYAATPLAPPAGKPRLTQFDAARGRLFPVSEEGVRAQLRTEWEGGALLYEFWIFPGAAAIVQQIAVELEEKNANGFPQNDAILTDEDATDGQERIDSDALACEADCIDWLELAPAHVKLRQVEFWDQTDRHNELVFEKEWLLHPNEGDLRLQGNVFVLEDPLTGSGFVMIKHAPLPHVRPLSAGDDLRVRCLSAATTRQRAERGERRSFQLAFRGHGAAPEGGPGYRSALIAYSGGQAGRTAALHTYQRQLRRLEPERDLRLLSNTWGDRSRDARIQEAFMLAEIEAGARLGVETIQIDDGWQLGRTSNSIHAGGVWEGFWAHEPRFWEPDPVRLPNGLAPIIAAAEAKGMTFGLWFAPDSANDFANWEKDAQTLLALYRSGVRYFKIDGVKARTKQGEARLHQFFQTVLEQSDGRIVFDLDVTAEIRPGYWGLPHTGPLFVENRYTDFRRYWPHQTLRNLWKLAHYVDPARLRMEWLNAERNVDLYGDDPLAPSAYSPDYLFAVTMLANPLGWFETSGLSEAAIQQTASLIAVWKRHRERLFAGRIAPVGSPPDGASWTGFVSLSADGAEGYALLFRERHPASECVLTLPQAAAAYDAETLYGEGTLTFDGGQLRARIAQPQRFLFARLTARR